MPEKELFQPLLPGFPREETLENEFIQLSKWNNSPAAIFLKFRRCYPRATDYLLSLYDLPDNYAVIMLSKKEWNRWYYFKKAVKEVDRIIRDQGEETLVENPKKFRVYLHYFCKMDKTG